MSRRLWIALFAAAAGTGGLLWWTDVPLGIPGEWTWDRIPPGEDGLRGLLLGCALALVALAPYAGVVWIGAQRLSRASRTEVVCWLACLVAAGFAWLSLLQESPPAGYRSSKAIQVLYYRGSSGYFYEARYGIGDVVVVQPSRLPVVVQPSRLQDLEPREAGETPAPQGRAGETPAPRGRAGGTPAPQGRAGETPAPQGRAGETPAPQAQAPARVRDAREFLAGYEARMAEGDVLHVGTHPPGLFLLHRGLIVLCARHPGLTGFVLQIQPDSAREAGNVIAGKTAGTQAPYLPRDQAALWLAALITQAAGVLALVPLYLLIRRSHSRGASWFAAALWPLVPALAVFLPKSDALYPFLSLTFLYLWLEGCRRRSWWRCALAGLVCWLGMFLSLAIVPVALLALLLSLWEMHTKVACGFADQKPSPSSPNPWPRFALSTAIGAAAFFSALIAFWAIYGVNLVNVWKWNVTNHAAFYGQFPRTWWKWLLVNPLELAFSVGLPVAVLVTWNGWREVRMAKREGIGRLGPFVCCAATFGLLWLSGKNSGETARLWLILMPWALWLAAGAFEPAADGDPSAIGKPLASKGALAILILQAALCIATVLRVTGFHQPPSLALQASLHRVSSTSSRGSFAADAWHARRCADCGAAFACGSTSG